MRAQADAYARRHQAARPGRRGRRGCLGLTLSEVVLSTLIVGVMAVAALETFGAATRSSLSNNNQGLANSLAKDLMSEILQQPYLDPDGAATFGTEPGESAASRADFDDVDDYHGWTSQPPQRVDGTTIPDRDAWRRRVRVRHVDPDDLGKVLPDNNDQGVKRIVLVVEHNGTRLAALTMYTTQAWTDVTAPEN